MVTKAKATTAKTSPKRTVKTAASDSPAKKATTSKKLAEEKDTTAKAVEKTTKKTATKSVAAKSSAKVATAKKTTARTSKPVAKVTRSKTVKPAATASAATKSKARSAKAPSEATADKTTAVKAKRTVKIAKEKTPSSEKELKTAAPAAKEVSTEKVSKAKTTKAQGKPAVKKTVAKVKTVAKSKSSKVEKVTSDSKSTPVRKAATVESKAAVPEKETPVQVEAVETQAEVAEAKTDLPKSSTQKAFEAAAEIAPLVQSHKSNGGTEVNAHEAQKAAEFLMNSMATKTDEHIVIDGITIPTQAELLEMPEEDYMNERQVAFFKWLLKQRESELKSNAGQTTENLRESTIAPDPADRATIEEEHALELRTRDRERKLLKKVQEALRRLENGEFGWCEETGEPIGIPRLLARPTATLSLEAQQRREQRQKLYGD